jgi:type VI secretion system protein ImpI
MQKALLHFIEDISPESVEKKVSASLFSSKEARAWDVFVALWESKVESHENGMLDVFLSYFSDAYEKISKSHRNK